MAQKHPSRQLVRPPRTPEAMAQFMPELQAAFSDLGIQVGDEFSVSAVPGGSSHDESSEDPRRIQLGPFTPDSETSRQAALQNYPRSGTQRWKVLTTIVASGGRTRDQLAEQLHLPDSSVDARVWELKQGGFVEESGRKERTRAAAEATVLVATRRGREEVEKAEGFTEGRLL